MGMYLDIYQIRQPVESCPRLDDIEHFDFEVAKWVDDKKFAQAAGEVFENEYVSCDIPYCCGMIYWRPKNIGKAIKWVEQNIDGNRKVKLVETLTLMKKNKDWYFNYS